ncbi:MAG TPA: lipopolysaccharide biosynthesis protein [Gemmatimonadales bacterium]|jgi:Membrane protein involved in the export of O-antigen and teichoic acid
MSHKPEAAVTGRRGLARQAVGNMAWVAWGSATVSLLRVLVLVILTRLLAPADFGLVSAALVVISFSLNFAQLGLGPALVQRPDLQPRHVSTAFYASIAFGVLVAAIVWLSAPLIAQFFRMEHLTPVVRVLALVFPISGLGTVPDSLLQRDLRFRVLANREIWAYAIGYGVVGVGLALLGWGVWALALAQLTQVLVRTVILLRLSPSLSPARPTWRSFVELMDYGAGQSMTRVGNILANQGDNLVVGRWLGAVPLGTYSRAYQLMAVPAGLLGDVLDKVLFPTMAKVQDDPRRLAAAFLRGTALLALVTLPVSVVAAVLAPELVVVTFGSRWAGLTAPFQVLALGMMFRTCYRMSDSLSRATGRVYRRAWRQALFALLVLLGSLAGQTRGIVGVATGVLVAFFLNYVSMAQLSLKITEVSWGRFFQVQLPAVRSSVAIGGVTLATMVGMRHSGLPPVVGLAVGGLAAVSVGLLAAWVAPTFALGHDGVYARNMLLGMLPALRKRFAPGRAS